MGCVTRHCLTTSGGPPVGHNTNTLKINEANKRHWCSDHRPDDGSSNDLWNVGKFLTDETTICEPQSVWKEATVTCFQNTDQEFCLRYWGKLRKTELALPTSALRTEVLNNKVYWCHLDREVLGSYRRSSLQYFLMVCVVFLSTSGAKALLVPWSEPRSIYFHLFLLHYLNCFHTKQLQ